MKRFALQASNSLAMWSNLFSPLCCGHCVPRRCCNHNNCSGIGCDQTRFQTHQTIELLETGQKHRKSQLHLTGDQTKMMHEHRLREGTVTKVPNWHFGSAGGTERAPALLTQADIVSALYNTGAGSGSCQLLNKTP